MNRGHLAWANSALHWSSTTTSPQNSLHVLHRWYWMPQLYLAPNQHVLSEVRHIQKVWEIPLSTGSLLMEKIFLLSESWQHVLSLVVGCATETFKPPVQDGLWGLTGDCHSSRCPGFNSQGEPAFIFVFKFCLFLLWKLALTGIRGLHTSNEWFCVKCFCGDNVLFSCCRATLVEGTVLSLLENKDGHIVGVEYKDKETGDTKVSWGFLFS